MMIINAMIRISSFHDGRWHDANGNELNDNTMISRVKNPDYKNNIWKHMITMETGLQSPA